MTGLDVQAVAEVSPTFTLDAGFWVDLEKEGPVVGLFGPTGSGKTTLLGAIAGTVPLRRGKIALGEATLFEWTYKTDLPPERRCVGLVPQDALLFPHLSVEENLRYGMRRARGREGPEFGPVAKVLELEDHLERAPSGLSGGERQRVALGRAILSAPRLLLLDEPVSALDEAGRFRALAFVERVVEEFAVPALFVSHQRNEILRLARTVVRMEAGRVVETGPAAEVLGHAPAPHGFDNLLRLEPGPGGGPGQALLSGRSVTVADGTSVDGACWARLPSAAVLLARHAPTDLSARNAVPGRVLAVTPAGNLVRVAVDAGQPLSADLTPGAVRDLALAPGAEVFCVFKAQSLEVLG